MGLGTNLTLTPKYDGYFMKTAIDNAQSRIEELLAGQNSLNTDTQTEINSLKAWLNDLAGYKSVLSADAAKDDTTITVDDAHGFEADDEIVILDETYIVDSINKNDITLKSGLAADAAANTEVIKYSTLDIESINEKMQILADIFSQEGTANDVFDALVILAQAWNNAGQMVQTVKGVFNSDTGTLDIDISSFGFASTDDYDVVGSISSLGALKTTVGIDKKDENTITITAYDRACFVEDAVLFDATDNNFDITVIITYARPEVHFTITDEDGETTEA